MYYPTFGKVFFMIGASLCFFGLGAIGLPLLCAACFCLAPRGSRLPFDIIGNLESKRTWRFVLILGFSAICLALWVQTVSSEICQYVWPAYAERFQRLIESQRDRSLYDWVGDVILEPILAQLLFSGVLLHRLKTRLMPFLSVILVAALYACLNDEVFGAYTLNIFTCFCVLVFGSLGPAMLVHAAYNLMILVGNTVHMTPDDFDAWLRTTPVILGLGVLGLPALIWMVQKVMRCLRSQGIESVQDVDNQRWIIEKVSEKG